ncbi:ASCH domain-containing protein [Streptomyces sp. NPDC085524]|uniref:ASCH domain-containing protein n=1 Tax=unclassified Streptomyces TaxID=2593676 RepID=UPI0035D5CC7C
MTYIDDLPPYELGFPGPLRDKLVAAVLSGAKTASTGLLAGYEAAGEPVPEPGQRRALLDSAGCPVAVLEVTEVRVVRLDSVDLAYAVAEGEGYASVAEWRASHEGFWHGAESRRFLGDPGFTVDDDTPVVTERFRLLERADGR